MKGKGKRKGGGKQITILVNIRYGTLRKVLVLYATGGREMMCSWAITRLIFHITSSTPRSLSPNASASILAVGTYNTLTRAGGARGRERETNKEGKN